MHTSQLINPKLVGSYGWQLSHLKRYHAQNSRQYFKAQARGIRVE
jgi:hypothetical protein